MSDTIGKWNFATDEARHDAIMEEAQIIQDGALAVAEENRRAAEEAAEASAPVWHWAAFWIGLFACIALTSIFGRT